MFATRRITARIYATCMQFAKLGNRGYKSGKAGSIRKAEDGAFGKLEAAREEEVFTKKQKEQLEKLKKDEIAQSDFHNQQIKEHEDAIVRHKKFLEEIPKFLSTTNNFYKE